MKDIQGITFIAAVAFLSVYLLGWMTMSAVKMMQVNSINNKSDNRKLLHEVSKFLDPVMKLSMVGTAIVILFQITIYLLD